MIVDSWNCVSSNAIRPKTSSVSLSILSVDILPTAPVPDTDGFFIFGDLRYLRFSTDTIQKNNLIGAPYFRNNIPGFAVN